ncbi:MAG: hypoxanthine phosphoribosyltransferase [Clostridia bacterium]|nr:hypoxanthine phosphoribosyltransferase [Clostridia bacterium]
MKEDIKQIIYSEEVIKEKVDELGKRITEDFSGKDPIVIGVLKGANVFLSDLIRKISIPLIVDFIDVSSYGLSTETSGVVKINKDLDFSIEDKDILIVEDIIDSGLTLEYLLKNLKSRNPKTIRICSLLDKPERRRVDIKVDYIGFQIPDEFIVGYGIDYAEKYRNLPYIASLKEEVYR